jgi:hypothetical protein
MYWAADLPYAFRVDALQIYRSPGKAQAWVAGADGAQGKVHGSSYSFLPAAGIASIGEYVERRHLRFKVRNEGAMRLSAFSGHIPSLREALDQTCQDTFNGSDPLLSATLAFSLADWQQVTFPWGLVALGNGKCADDRGLMPYMDSSGAAAHTSARAALDAALLEFVERQAWVAFWLGGGRAREVEAPNAGIGREFGVLDEIGGEFRAFLLDAGLAAYTVFCFHIDRGIDCRARFSFGLAASLRPDEALARAVRELLHYRQFADEKSVALADNAPSVGRLERNAVLFESQEIHNVLTLRQVLTERIPFSDFTSFPALSGRDLRRSLLAVGPLFAYFGYETGELGEFHVVRVCSPSFYLHCDPGVRLNFDNAFARHLGISNPPQCFRTPTCLP